MTKIKNWRLALVVLCLAVLLGMLVFAFVNVPIGTANAEDVNITIYTNGNGSVSSGEQTSDTIAEDSISVTVTEEGLTVKATPAEGYIFRNWTTDAAGSKAVSMKLEDSFTYEEVQALGGATLYANFTTSIEDQREEAKITINYDERLGDVYFFTDNKDVTEEQLQLHGLKIKSDEPFEVAYVIGKRNPRASDVVIGAIAKKEVQSTMDPSKMTSVVFENWSATYTIQHKAVVTNQLPEVCTISSSTGSQWPDGEKQWTPGSHHPHGNIWWAGYWERGTQYTNVHAGKINTDYWWTDPYYHASDYETTIGIENNSIHANFAEVAATPTMNITPTVDDAQEEQVEMEGNEAIVSMPYGKENSVNVLIQKFEGEGLTEQNYNVSLKKGIKLDDQQEIVESVQVSPVSDDILGFSILNIETNCTVVITPSYESETNYIIEQFYIYINLVSENGLQDIVSAESEEITASNLPDGIDWKLDPQYNSNALAFSSGLTYPENITQNEASQMHFQVKGSGVFTFEMYLDGMNYYSGYGHAVLGFDNPVDKSKVSGASANFTDGKTTLLATGDSTLDFVAGAVYQQCKIKATDKVSRMSTSNWCNVSFNISDKSDEEITDIYIAHIVTSYNTTTKGNLDMYRPHTVMIVRNVAFYQGMSDVKWDIYDNGNGDKTNYGNIIAKTNGEDAKQGNTDSGTKIDFDLEFDNGKYKFYGWSDGNELLSTQQNFTYTVKGSSSGESKTNIYAVLSTNEERYVYRFGGKFYDIDNLQQALNDAESSSSETGNIYILESLTLSNKTLSEDNLTIPKNVNLIIPFDETYRIHGSDAEGDETIADIAWRLPQNETKFKHIVIIIDNITVNVNGGLYLGGVVNNQSHNYQGHTSGAYSQIENNGTIIVGEGGVFDVYGRVTGSGKVEVQNKGSLYQPFLILDYSGGTDALGLFMSGLTPFRRYSMINIECPITVNYGGVLYGHASLYALSSYFSLDQPFISYDMGSNLGGDGKGHDTFITLTNNAKVEITYDSNCVVGNATTTNGTAGIGKTKMVFTGGAKFSYMLFTAAGISVPTNSVCFSIPYNFEVELNGNEAQYEVKTDFKLMPGSKVTIGAGATLTCNANLNILDGLVQGTLHDKSYPKAEDLKAANYSQSGNLIVNGKLIIGKKTPVPPLDLFSAPSPDFDYTPIPATFLGIVQTNGTQGCIQIGADTILEGKIVEGATDSNYFEYTTTARVWDVAHGCFAQLEAGKTYNAVSNDEFYLEELKYATAPGGPYDQTLNFKQGDVKGQLMHGSWMEVHDGHTYDWTPNAEKDKFNELGDGNTHTTLHRQCTALGCNHTEEKELLYVVDSIGGVEYDGDKVGEEDIKALFVKLYGDNLQIISSIVYDSGITNVGDAYDVTIALTGALWLVEGRYVDSHTLKFAVTAKHITVTAQDQESVYGDDVVIAQDKFTAEGLCQNDSLVLTIRAKNGAEIKDQGTYALEIVMGDGGSNANYQIDTVDGTYTVKHREVTVTINSATSAEGDALVDVSNIGYKVTSAKDFVGEDKATFDSHIQGYEVSVTDATAGKTYDITMKFNGDVTAQSLLDGTTMTNYKITIVNGTYSVTDSIFKNVTFTGKDVTYNKQNHKLEVQGAPQDAVIVYTYHDNTSEEFVPFPADGISAAGTYTIKVEITLSGHTNTYSDTAILRIAQENITVHINLQSKEYDTLDGVPTCVENTDWSVNSGTVYDGDDLGVSLSITAGSKNQATKYDIVGSWTNNNYNVTFEGGSQAYEITKKTLTVTAKPQHSVYGDNPVSVSNIQNKDDFYTIEGWLESAALTVTLSHNVTKESGFLANGYVITVTVPADQANLNNYNLQTVNGTYTVNKKAVTVTIRDQDDVYAFDKTYAFDQNAWDVQEETPLANGEDRSVLGVTLARPNFDGGGTYPIIATASPANYDVTFDGKWAEADANQHKAGVYTVNRQHIAHDPEHGILFSLLVDGEAYNGVKVYRYVGKNFQLDANIQVLEDTWIQIVDYSLNINELTGVGEYDIKVTVNSRNYEGSHTFHVEVGTAEGFSQNLHDVLVALEGIVGNVTYDVLEATEEHFAMVKQIETELAKLSPTDLERGAAQLEKYQKIVRTWNNAADIDDDVIQTAKDLADAPIKWLFAALQVSALLCALFVVGKGGLM